jgi:CubicO group peptidase (beta-lactamase class C family)
MQKLLTILIVACGLVACGNSDSKKDSPIVISEPDQFTLLRNTVELELAQNNAVAVSVAIYQQGDIVFAEAFGEKVQGGEAATPDTLFQLGSTTKMFTGLATLQLIQQGMLNTQDKLVNVLPNIQYPAAQALTWQDVNIQHMLTHQGGFLDDYIGSDPDDELVEYMSSTYPQQNRQMNPPGLFHNYSNPNWSYLGAVIEHLSQNPFAQHMQQSVFEPLGMQRTSMERSQVIADGDYAIGFQTNGVDDVVMNSIEQIQPWPSGSPAGSETWSTPKEQLKMAEFLLNGNLDVLSDQLREEMVAPHVDTELAGLPMYYGYGLFVDDGFIYDGQWYAEKIWQHGGNTTAYTSLFWILPEKNIAVSIMSSGAYNDFEASMLAALNAVTDLPSPQDIPFLPSNPDEYFKHEGVYAAGEFSIIVNLENERLTITIPEFDANNIPYQPHLVPLGDSTFIATVENEDLLVSFLPENESGESVYLRNRDAVGIKEGHSSMGETFTGKLQKISKTSKRMLD